jgi:hypothetical protein
MTDKGWSDLRERIKRCNPKWHTCSCLEKRAATQLHEEWSINRRSHHKRLLRTAFLCPRCHGPTNEGWFPVFHLNLAEYLDDRFDFSRIARGVELGYRAAYIWAHNAICAAPSNDWKRIYDAAYAETKEAYTAEFLSGEMPLRRSLKDARAGRATLLPYRIDLSALGQYGCDPGYVRGLELLAATKGKADMLSLLARVRSDGQSIRLYERDRPRDRRTWSRVAFSLPGSRLYTL